MYRSLVLGTQLVSFLCVIYLASIACSIEKKRGSVLESLLPLRQNDFPLLYIILQNSSYLWNRDRF